MKPIIPIKTEKLILPIKPKQPVTPVKPSTGKKIKKTIKTNKNLKNITIHCNFPCPAKGFFWSLSVMTTPIHDQASVYSNQYDIEDAHVVFALDRHK